MTVYLVTRHAGACDWARQEGIDFDQAIDHLNPTIVHPGDTVIGALPVNLAAEVCARGGRYLHLILKLSPELRGRELTSVEMRTCGARLQGYRVIAEDTL